jgi:type I restriction enzyme S subunit
MSELSYLEKLLDGAEVEWLSLSKVFNLRMVITVKLKKNFGRW